MPTTETETLSAGRITAWRVRGLFDTSRSHVEEYPVIYGIEARVSGIGWARLGRDDDSGQALTFATADEAEVEVERRRTSS